MKKISFIIAILGISYLVFMLNAGVVKITEDEELQGMIANKKVTLSGEVESERDFDGFKIMKIDGIGVVCDCKIIYLGKEVEVIGFVEEYEGRKQVRALEIGVIE